MHRCTLVCAESARNVVRHVQRIAEKFDVPSCDRLGIDPLAKTNMPVFTRYELSQYRRFGHSFLDGATRIAEFAGFGRSRKVGIRCAFKYTLSVIQGR